MKKWWDLAENQHDQTHLWSSMVVVGRSCPQRSSADQPAVQPWVDPAIHGFHQDVQVFWRRVHSNLSTTMQLLPWHWSVEMIQAHLSSDLRTWGVHLSSWYCKDLTMYYIYICIYIYIIYIYIYMLIGFTSWLLRFTNRTIPQIKQVISSDKLYFSGDE